MTRIDGPTGRLQTPAGPAPTATTALRLVPLFLAAVVGLACSDRQAARPITYENVTAADPGERAAPTRLTNVAEVAAAPPAPTPTPAQALRPGEYLLNARAMAYLPATVDGHKGRFLVDTGSTLNVVNQRIASTLTAAADSHKSIGTAGAAVIDVRLYDPPHERVGPFDLDRYGPVAGFDFAGMPRSGTGEMLGVVGSCVLGDASLQVDFKRGCFSFLPATVPASGDLGFAVPLVFEDRLRLPRVTMTVNGRPVDMYIDTGDDSYGSLAADVFDTITEVRVLPGHKVFTAAGPSDGRTPVRQIESIAFADGRPYHNVILGRGGPISRIGMRFLWQNDAVTISPASRTLFVRQKEQS